MAHAATHAGALSLPRGALTVQVIERIARAPDTVTFTLALPGTRQAPSPYLPGQFITLNFPTSSGQTTLRRSYSLCGDGRVNVPWEITIKRQPGGIISNHFYSHVQPGMLLQTSLPQGHFILPPRMSSDMLLIFVAAGSGITPIYGMLRMLARLSPAYRPRAMLHYAYRSPYDAVYGQELAALDPQQRWLTRRHYVSTYGYRLHAAQVVTSLTGAARNAEWYICGPTSLRKNIEAAALGRGVSPTRIHTEAFASPPARSSITSQAGGNSHVCLADSNAVLSVQPGETLLETLERHGYQPDSSCRVGACGTCRMRLLTGHVRNSVGAGLTEDERASGYVLSCVAEPVGDVSLATGDAASQDGAGLMAPGQWASTRKAIRRGLLLASLGVCGVILGVIAHSPLHQTTQQGTVQPPALQPAGSGGNGGAGNNNNAATATPSGPSSVQTLPNLPPPNTSTGTS